MSNAEAVILEAASNNSHDAQGAAEPPPQRLSLLDRMDPSIGEASAGIGALLTELVRRSLRGGVSNIDYHLTEFSEEQVHAALERQLPLVRDVATEIADATSREISRLAAVQLTEETQAKAQEILSALQETDGRLTQAVTDVDQKFHQSLDETGRKLAADLSQKENQFREATAAVTSTVERLGEETRQTTSQLAETIASARQETDTRLNDFQSELRESAKRSWQKVKDQLDELRSQTAGIPQVADRVSQIEAGHRDLLQQLSAHHAQLQSQMQKHIQSLEQQLHAALQQCANLGGRLDELERPRGISAWFQKLRGGSKKSPPTDEPAEQDE